LSSEIISDGKLRRLANLRPFPKGVSGNPGGRGARRERMLADELASLTQHLGRALTRPEELLLDELVSVRLTRPGDSTEATKRATSVSKLTEALYGHGKPEPKPLLPSSPSLTGNDLLARSRARMAVT
jgi:hypothetical protein